ASIATSRQILSIPWYLTVREIKQSPFPARRGTSSALHTSATSRLSCSFLCIHAILSSYLPQTILTGNVCPSSRIYIHYHSGKTIPKGTLLSCCSLPGVFFGRRFRKSFPIFSAFQTLNT